MLDSYLDCSIGFTVPSNTRMFTTLKTQLTLKRNITYLQTDSLTTHLVLLHFNSYFGQFDRVHSSIKIW